MVPLKRGHETDLIEIPASWYLDDLPPMMFIKKSPNSHGFVNPRDIEQMWRDQFDWVYREIRLRGVPDHHPSGRFRPAAGADDAGAALPSHDPPSGRQLRHDERDGGRFRPALAAQAVAARCALCGVLGARALDRRRRAAGCFYAQYRRHRRRREPRAAAIANRILAHFGMSLADWQGTPSCSRRDRQDRDFDDLGHLWTAAERLRGRSAIRSRGR